MIVSMNMLSFVFLGAALGLVLPGILAGPYMTAFWVWVPINVSMTLRGAYGSGIIGAALKTFILWVLSTIAFSLLLVGLLALGLSQI